MPYPVNEYMDIFGIFLLNTGNSSVTCLNCYTLHGKI